MANEFYEVLGVSPDAFPDEVKRAYFKAVHEHSPEKDPEQFKIIRAAYEALSDPVARKNYDTMQQFGGEVQRLSDEAGQHMADEEWDEAAKCYKRILVLDSSVSAARQGLGLCLARSEDFSQALAVVRQLVQSDANVPAYWLQLGAIYYAWYNDVPQGDSRETDLLKHAQSCYEKAMRLNPGDAAAYQGIARVRQGFKDWSGAAQWLERAVSADGKLDLEDFDSLCQLAFVHAVGRDETGLKSATKRLSEIAPEDDDAKKYMAMRLAYLGVELCEGKLFDAGASMLGSAAGLDPANAEIKKMRVAAAKIGNAFKEWQVVKDDEYLLGPLRGLILLNLKLEYDEAVSEREWREMLDALASYTPWHIKQSLDRVKQYYKATWLNNEDLFKKLYASVANATPPPAPSSSCFVVTATYGSPRAYQVDLFRRWRDERLAVSRIGRMLIRTYAVVGPHMAQAVRQSEGLRGFSRLVLDVIARRLARGAADSTRRSMSE